MVFLKYLLAEIAERGTRFSAATPYASNKTAEARKASSLRSRVEWLLLGWNLGGSTPHLVLSENQAMDGTHMGPYLPYPPHL